MAGFKIFLKVLLKNQNSEMVDTIDPLSRTHFTLAPANLMRTGGEGMIRRSLRAVHFSTECLALHISGGLVFHLWGAGGCCDLGSTGKIRVANTDTLILTFSGIMGPDTDIVCSLQISLGGWAGLGGLKGSAWLLISG